jgi:internalin A
MPDGSDDEYNVSDLLGTVINGSNERALLEEILRITENESEQWGQVTESTSKTT